MTASVTADAIRAILAAHSRTSRPIDQIGDNDNLFNAGMTSLASVDVILALEEKFGVEFADHMMHRKTFESIAAIAAAIESLPVKAEA
jgi:acyl carrier protein